MEIQKKLQFCENLNNLRLALEDFKDHHISKRKIQNLENEIKNLENKCQSISMNWKF